MHRNLPYIFEMSTVKRVYQGCKPLHFQFVRKKHFARKELL